MRCKLTSLPLPHNTHKTHLITVLQLPLLVPSGVVIFPTICDMHEEQQQQRRRMSQEGTGEFLCIFHTCTRGGDGIFGAIMEACEKLEISCSQPQSTYFALFYGCLLSHGEKRVLPSCKHFCQNSTQLSFPPCQ